MIPSANSVNNYFYAVSIEGVLSTFKFLANVILAHPHKLLTYCHLTDA